jgi:hypothetical protein
MVVTRDSLDFGAQFGPVKNNLNGLGVFRRYYNVKAISHLIVLPSYTELQVLQQDGQPI